MVDTAIPLRPFGEADALAWLRAQPDGRTELPLAELARRWGWTRSRAGRRIDAWTKAGLARRRGKALAAVDSPRALMTARIRAALQPAAMSLSSIEASPVKAVLPSIVPSSETPKPEAVRVSPPLVALSYGFFGLGVGINVWNAWTGGAIADTALPAAMGGLAEGVVFFLPAWAMTLPWRRQALAWGLFLFISAFALTNSLRMASIVAADQTAARADRQTIGVQTADRALDAARARRDEACGRGQGRTVACRDRQAEVVGLETARKEAGARVASEARPEAGDFAKLVAWTSFGRLQPGADDFAMLWLLFRTLLPQVGGLVLMLARGRH